VQLAEVAGGINHSATVGALREEYIIEFIKKLIPDSVNITSGFIVDAYGHISPQLDLIVTKKSALPLMGMKEGLSVVPIESALLVAEIKSTLDIKALAQVEKQNKSISEMYVSGEIGKQKFIVPTMIIAFSTNIKESTLMKWLESNLNTTACCVLKSHTIVKNNPYIIYQNSDSEIRHFATLSFVSMFYNAIVHLNEKRDFVPSMDNYLTVDDTVLQTILKKYEKK
jgi:hypothetical protein